MEKDILLDKYIQGSLNPEETSLFEKLKEENPDLKDEIRFLNDVREVAGRQNRMDLKKDLKRFEERIHTSKSTTSKVLPLYQKWIAAAIIFLTVALAGVAIWQSSRINTDQLYAVYFEPYQNVVLPFTRGNNSEKNDSEKEAFLAYEQKDYEHAVLEFQNAYEQYNRPYLLLYQGNSQLALQQYDKAARTLEDYLARNGKLTDRGMWYLSLAYLKLKQTDKSIYMLKDLIRNSSFKRKEAPDLLSEIDK
ncbi:hypothetical protein NBT05_06935 [Aquimarina sp. ERC-38]|uniref:tetratricopeptide repeat protein n=1 Tax=Aquimarina sp. ERC-38 TaxID=2949996 RepID=UPI0022465C6F|nr:hypothetical protein [Aquimarina sp. ERC-38]UZO82203.1 hypothetical protein NBT05_06935 [Aquimarina sp. ERC-38]